MRRAETDEQERLILSKIMVMKRIICVLVAAGAVLAASAQDIARAWLARPVGTAACTRALQGPRAVLADHDGRAVAFEVAVCTCEALIFDGALDRF